MNEIVISEQFTRFPGGRYRKHGSGSGQEFREVFLVPALQNEGDVVVKLDGAYGYPASFIEEAFGGLIREGLTLSALRARLTVMCDDAEYQVYVDQAWAFIEDAAKHLGANTEAKS